MALFKIIRQNTLCRSITEQLSTVRKQSTKMQIACKQKTALDEKCILVDRNDKVVGTASKKYCHEINKDNSVPLHRAFSVFLFNSKGELLLQKRSSNKITFPDHFTNTCCSHPLSEIPGESEEANALGICRAAKRRLGYELGIPASEIDLSDLVYLTRIYYAHNGDAGSIWGEHEIDYVLFMQKDNVTLDPNPDEISELQWVSKENIHSFVQKLDCPLTPWFNLILKYKLDHWWNNLNNLKAIQDHKTITYYE